MDAIWWNEGLECLEEEAVDEVEATQLDNQGPKSLYLRTSKRKGYLPNENP